jgi:hypothetical protein
MTEKINNKYRIKSIRASFWDYHWAGAYFITICTRGRRRFFGYVKDNEMVLSDIGKIVESEWLRRDLHGHRDIMIISLEIKRPLKEFPCT